MLSNYSVFTINGNKQGRERLSNLALHIQKEAQDASRRRRAAALRFYGFHHAPF